MNPLFHPILGAMVVLLALGILILSCSLIAPLGRAVEKRRQKPAAPPPETLIPVIPTPPPPPSSPDADDSLAIRAAIIAAAVSAVLAEPHRIVSIQPASDEWDLRRAWSLEGRRTIYQSHSIR